MNKKFFMSLLSIMMVAMLSVGFTSCGDDEDSIGGNSPIVGSWSASNSPWSYTFTFSSDGTGHGSGVTSSGSVIKYEFTWSGNTTVKCKGVRVRAYSSGEVDTKSDWKTTFNVTGSTMTGDDWVVGMIWYKN